MNGNQNSKNLRARLFLFCAIFCTGLVHSVYPQNQIQRDPSVLDGFAEAGWGISYELLREKFISLATDPESKETIEILFEKKDQLLLVRRNGIEYLYRFYKTPDIVKDARTPQSGIQPEQDPTIESRTEYRENGILFSVGVLFPFVESERIQEKLENKYGKPKKKSLDDKKIAGAAIWELTDRREDPPRGGYIVQWRENYKNQPFTRRIDYFSVNIRNLIEKEYKEFFSARETKTLRDLLE